MIDLDDPAVIAALLGRPPEDVLTAVDRALIREQVVCITGAGGSVGFALARQVAACGPARLVLFEQSELNLFRAEGELTRLHPRLAIDGVLGDVTRRGDLDEACLRTRPDVLYHAAAYKHVTLTERAIVPSVRTNVLGTLCAVRAAREVGARFVLVSTDKAADARSVLGATKRLAELVTLDAREGSFRPVAVRFGNILGSSGSLVPVVLERVRAGRPIQITHPDATRFFMSPQEAVALVLKADLLGEDGEIFCLDMGRSVRVLDLVTRLIALATPPGQPPPAIEIIGLRTGEKLHEQLATGHAALGRTRHSRILVSTAGTMPARRLRSFVELLGEAVRRADAFGTLEALRRAVPEYEPASETWSRELSRVDDVHRTLGPRLG